MPSPLPRRAAIHDLRGLLWSSIDNDTSRDLDQAEVAERTGAGIRVRIAIADVDTDVPAGSPIDGHAASQTTSVYTGVLVFSMLPEELSTDLTSLNEDADRLAMVVDFVVVPAGRCLLAQYLSGSGAKSRRSSPYNGVGAWLEGTGAPPPKVAASPDLAAQLKLQDEAGPKALLAERHCFGRA